MEEARWLVVETPGVKTLQPLETFKTTFFQIISKALDGVKSQEVQLA